MYNSLVHKAKAFNSVLKAISTYKNSKAQAHLHDFNTTLDKVSQLKSSIDLSNIQKDSEGRLMIREYLFQEEKPAISINYTQRYTVPIGKWTMEEINEYYEKQQEIVKIKDFADDNQMIIHEFNDQLKAKFLDYYAAQGKKNYSILVNEEVAKIASMSDEQFDEFIQTLQSFSHQSN